MVKSARTGSSPAKASNTCELLCELYTGTGGAVELARLLQGNDAGRLVMLRPLSARLTAPLTPLVERVQHITHPRLLKVIGCLRVGDQAYLASEYLPGASFAELGRRLCPTTTTEVAAVLRILREALLAAHSGARLLEGIYGYRAERTLYPETIWIADFGETFLTELAVFEALLGQGTAAGSGIRTGSYLHPRSGPSADVRAAGELLVDVLGRQRDVATRPGMSGHASKALAGLVAGALSDSGERELGSPAAMADALARLPSELQASADDVRSLLGSTLSAALEQRRGKLAQLGSAAQECGHDDRTWFHRPSGSGTHQVNADHGMAPGSGTHSRATEPRVPPARPVSAADREVPPAEESAVKGVAVSPCIALEEAVTTLYVGGAADAAVPSGLPTDADASRMQLGVEPRPNAGTDASGATPNPSRPGVASDPNKPGRLALLVVVLVLLALASGLASAALVKHSAWPF